MKYISLNYNSKSTLFQNAVKRGLAPDRGLYFPETIPQLPGSFFDGIEKMSIPEMAYRVIKPYVGNKILKKKLMEIVTETLDFDFPNYCILIKILLPWNYFRVQPLRLKMLERDLWRELWDILT